ncbi:MAG: Na+/H+ antiporter NhaC [Bacteroidota bacterium]|nr:Na+/H+ antiporter NhaC [Bacteroidota bacterium]
MNPTQTNSADNSKNKELSIFEAFIPVVALILMLFYNVFFVFGDNALNGSNQFILLLGAAIAAVIGFFKKTSYSQILNKVSENLKSTTGALLILLMVGALSGTWLVSGIIPTMIYYGLQLLNPTFFLVATVIICAIISIATGSSWTTSATVGIALMGIGESLGISTGMTAGAVLSGAYFGDKMSPLSDTTNLAPAMAGAELFTHIKYMTITTVPTLLITLLLFFIIGLNIEVIGTPNVSDKLEAINSVFNISPWLMLVPSAVVVLIVKKTPPLVALLVGTLLAALTSVLAQPQILMSIAETESYNFETAYKGVMQSITIETAVETTSADLNDLFSSGGMQGMLDTIWLIICAMVFGGVMDAIGALSRISKALLSLATSTLGLFASTVASCLALNVTASDQYLALVIPGKMFKKAYKDKGLAPENLSRTLEDSGTVTSVLIPWNTCGAFQSSVLGVSVANYFLYAFFNWISPFMTLLIAGLSFKIKQLKS